MKKPRNILLGIEPFTMFNADYFAYAKTLGYYTIAFANLTRRPPSLAVLQSVDEMYNCDVAAPDFLRHPVFRRADLRHARMLHGKDMCFPIAERVCRRLGIPFMSQQSARACAEKDVMHTFARRAGLTLPRTQVLRATGALPDFSRCTFPLLLKPVDSAGGEGLKIVQNPHEARAHVQSLFAQTKNFFGVTPVGRVLAQEIIVGEEYSVELLINSRGGVIFSNVTQKEMTTGAGRFPLAHLLPAPIARPLERRLIATTHALARELGLRSIVVHCEVIVRDDIIYFIELAARPPGARIDDAIDLAYGIDFHRLVIENTFTTLAPLHARKKQYAYVRLFMTDQPGVLRGVHGIDAARKIPGVQQIVQVKPNGTSLRGLASGVDRLGVIITTGKTPDAAKSAAVRAMRTMRIDVQSP